MTFENFTFALCFGAFLLVMCALIYAMENPPK